jgi:hypothetical protein
MAQPAGRHRDRRLGISISKKSFFGTKHQASEVWHQQIDFTAGVLRPSDAHFPWDFVRKHTDTYLRKKGKLTQHEIDLRLGILIDSHEAKDVAIAAAAHAMSPASLRAILNVELSVAPITYYGLDTYLLCLIAAHHCNPASMNDLEARWATGLLPFAIHGSGAAGRTLEGICMILRTTTVPNMNVLPDFSILSKKAFKDFGSDLQGFKIKCEWVRAYSAIQWLSDLIKSSPAHTPPGHLLPEHLLDVNLAIWRIWSKWRPNLERIKMLDGLNSARRGVLPDMLALEGPDFISGNEATLRDGLIAQYGGAKPLVQFQSLLIKVTSCNKEELKSILDRVASAMDIALSWTESAFNLFVQLTITRAITDDGLLLLEAVSKLSPTPMNDLCNAIVEIWSAKPKVGGKGKIGGRNVNALSRLVSTLDDSEDLRKVLLQPWLIQGIEKCLMECQGVVREQIEAGNEWKHLASELHAFSMLIKESNNCLDMLDGMIQRQLDVLPPTDVFEDALEIYQYTGGVGISKDSTESDPLGACIEEFCIDRLIERTYLSAASEEIVVAILAMWKNTKGTENRNSERRVLALTVSKLCGTDGNLRCKCLVQIPQLPTDFVEGLHAIMEDEWACGEDRCVRFTKLLAGTVEVEVVQVWKELLYEMIKSHSATIMRWSLKQYKPDAWFGFLLELNTLFADIIQNPKASPPTILQLHLHLWIQELSAYMPYLIRFEETLGAAATPAVHCILCGGDGMWTNYFLRILDGLRIAQEQPIEKLMQAVATYLARNGNNAAQVAEAVRSLLATTEEGADACHRIMISHLDKDIPAVVTEVSVAGWLQNNDLTLGDVTAIQALAFLLNIERHEFISDEKLKEAAEWYQAQELKIMGEAARLDRMRRALKARDPEGTAILLEQLGIPDSSALDDELESLPLDIIDAFEKRSETEVEITFPLTAFTELQLTAMGATASKALLLRVYLDPTHQMPPAFCIHLDDDWAIVDPSTQHTPWVCLTEAHEPPQWPYCAGRENALAWACSRIVHRHLKLLEEVGLAGFHELMTNQLANYASNCVVCGYTHKSSATNMKLRRAVPCQLPSCSMIWNNISLEIRIPEIRSDPFVLDMLLTGVYAAAISTRSELLPGCPIKSTQAVVAILNCLPPVSALALAPDLNKALKRYHKDAAVELLTWACNHYRGFITTASGICRIPGMPSGTHQFVLANASPELELSFAKQLPRYNPQTRILFHGTSLDRLPSILAQGLKIQSGTNLQRTGAAHGKGIYLAEDPSTSFSYSPAAISWKSSGLSNMRLLLGCEVVGNGNSVTPGIHVIRDERQVMVRYVFLLTSSAYAPVAGHVVPAMGSAVSALRSGAV